MSAGRRTRALLAGLAVAGAIGIAACGGGGEEAAAPSPVAASESSEPPAGDGSGASLPAPLAANRERANELIDGSTAELEATIEGLRGHPVVVNQWGSWCPPCRAEFPFFAEVAEANAEQVAFVGVDIQDDRAAAEEFLDEFPVPYPSIFDPSSEAVFALGWGQVSPTTWFLDERGEIVHQRPGAYADASELQADIETHLLG